MKTKGVMTKSLKRLQIDALGLAEGFFESQVLFSVNELGVFDLLAAGSRTLDELADGIPADRGALERLLNAAVAIGLLDLVEGRYENGPLADRVLVSDRPGYLGSWMRLMSRWMKAWTHLTESVRTGRPAQDPWLHLGKDPEYTRDFIMGMHDYAQLRGSEIVEYLDFGGGLRLLDLGGGPGTYAIQFAKRWPDLRVTVFDLPDVVRIASENSSAAGVDGQVSTVAGNYHEEEVGADYDVVFISDVLHQEDPETCRLILKKAHRALKPGGRLVVQGMFLNEDRTSPRWPLMHSLLLLVLYGSGRAYTANETLGFMEEAGFTNGRLQRMSLLNVNSLILGERG
jgi:2-polyprenyl-3-methyl-5-hydroxy-6-metoxy-1,4-benzoquinol methylase